jgi:hypothetical protein
LNEAGQTRFALTIRGRNIGIADVFWNFVVNASDVSAQPLQLVQMDRANAVRFKEAAKAAS